MRFLWMIVALGLIVRLAYVIWYPQEPVTFDAAGYDKAALAMLNPDAAVESGRGPVYPAFLAATYSIFGHSLIAVRIIQALLVSVTAVLAFILARSIFDSVCGLIAAGLVSFYPGFIFYSGLLLTETVFALILTVLALCFLQLRRREGWPWAIACGLVLGLATLCRSEILGVAAPMTAWLVWAAPRMRSVVLALAVCAITALVVVAPGLLHRPTETTSRATASAGVGALLWLSTYPEDWQEWYPDREPLRSLLDCRCDPQELEARFVRAAWRNVADSPGQYLVMGAKRFVRFWVGSHSIVVSGLEASFSAAYAHGHVGVVAVKALLLMINMLLVGLGLAGIYVARALWRAWLPLMIVIGFINGVHVVLFSTSRYQVPVMPLVLVLAAPVIHSLVAGSRVRAMAR